MVKILEIEEVKGENIAVTSHNPTRDILAEGINLTTGNIMHKIAVEVEDGFWVENWYRHRQATEEEKVEILADLPRFQEKELKDKLFHAAYLVANWSEDVNFALKKYNLPASYAKKVLSLASEIAEDME